MEYEACEDLQKAEKVAHEALSETEQPSQQFGCLGEIAGAVKKHSLDRKHSCEVCYQFPYRQDCSCILVPGDGMEGPSSCKAGHHCGCWIFLWYEIKSNKNFNCFSNLDGKLSPWRLSCTHFL